jgi:PTS system mannose-specific IIA component
VDAARRIVGDITGLGSLALGWDDGVAAARARIEESLARLDEGDGVVILTDMFGGTPTNLSLTFLKKEKIEIVTGVNLAMLIKFANQRTVFTVSQLAARLSEQGRESIQVASDLLARRESRG